MKVVQITILKKHYLVHFILFGVSTLMHAAISISANVTGPLTINEGQSAIFSYDWNITHDTGASYTKGGRIYWTYDRFTQHIPDNSGFSGRLSHSQEFFDQGTKRVEVIRAYDVFRNYELKLYDYHRHGFSRHEHYYGSVTPPSAHLIVNVINVAPTITSISSDMTVDAHQRFYFNASASDPGKFDTLFYEWDLDEDGEYDDYSGASGLYTFSQSGERTARLRVSDGDGGFDYDSFQITVNAIPEPSSAFLLGVGGLGLFVRRR